MTGKNFYRASLYGTLIHIRNLGFEPRTVIDVGAALGTFALYEVFPESRHLLIEPIAENEPYLARICRKLPKAEYIIAAATTKSGTVNLTVHPGLLHSSVVDNPTTADENIYRRTVPGITLDRICRERKLEKPYLIKIDVDGNEVDVLASATEILKDTEYIIVEVTLFYQIYDVIDFMRTQGFIVYDIINLEWRPSDRTLWQCDMAFVKESSPFRKNRLFIEQESAKVVEDYQIAYRQQFIDYIEKNYSDEDRTSLSNQIAIRDNFRLRDINLIIFPDWNQSEESVYQDFASVISTILARPDKSQITLLVDTTNISEEEANMALSSMMMNLMMEQDSDVADGPEITLIGQLNEGEWDALLNCTNSRIVLENENREAIARVNATNLPTCELENLSAICF